MLLSLGRAWSKGISIGGVDGNEIDMAENAIAERDELLKVAFRIIDVLDHKILKAYTTTRALDIGNEFFLEATERHGFTARHKVVARRLDSRVK